MAEADAGRHAAFAPSMKVPPKRKGNQVCHVLYSFELLALNESPSEKEGKCVVTRCSIHAVDTLNESPSEKEGKCRRHNLPSK